MKSSLFTRWPRFLLVGACCPLLFSIFLASLNAAVPAEDFKKANQLYTDNNFSEAALIYDTLIKNQGGSAALYFNLGNALARQGDVGRAVLNFERSLVLNPQQSEVKTNLEKVRRSANLPEPASLSWAKPLLAFNQQVWVLSLIVAFWVIATSLAYQLFLSKRFDLRISKACVFIICLMTATGLISILGMFAHYKQTDRAVILAPNAPLQVSPFAGAAAASSLKSGETVRVAEVYGEFIYTATDDGKKGWVRTAALEKIQ